MKKITLLMALVTVSFGFSQNQTFDLTFEGASLGSNPVLWNVFENDTNPAFEVVVNPSASGVNTSATVAKMTTLIAGNPWAGCETQHGTLGEWVLVDGYTTSISIDVYKSVISDVGIKMVNTTSGTIFELLQPNTVINAWETLTYDLTGLIVGNGENHNIDQIVVFPDWQIRGTDNINYFDNISWEANKLADPVLPSCSDGIQNGDETGIDCGGSSCSSCPTFPFDFETPTPFLGADGASFNIVSDGGNMVGEIQSINAQNYSNAQISTEALDFSGPAKGFSMKVKGNRSIPILFKVEVDGNPSIFYENSQNYSTPGQWQRLTFDFTGETSQGLLNKTVLFFEILGAPTNPTDDTFLFDDILFGDLGALYVDDNELFELKAFPNPAQDRWTIIADQDILNIQFFDILGKSVETTSPNTTDITIDVSQWSQGVYFAIIRTHSGVQSIKLMKE